MITEVVMPQMGADMKEGTVIRWLKAEGAEVNRGEIIAEIETDKANIEIEAFGGGVFRKQIAREGDVVPVGTVIAVIAAPEDDISRYEGATATSAAPGPAPAAEPSAPKTEEPAPAVEAAPAASRPGTEAAERPEGRLRVSPVARKIATDKGLDLSTVRGSGPDGRILRRDVEAAEAAPRPVEGAAAATAPAAPKPAEFVPAARPSSDENVVSDLASSRMRLTIARRTQQAKQEVPHYYLGVHIDMTEAIALQESLNKSLGDQGRITINDLVILATARSLTQHPKFNAYWVDDHVQTHTQVNIGIAVAMDDGLVAPAVMDVNSKGLLQISQEARDVARRARSGNLRPEEYTAATFSISNAGVFGIEEIAPIITQPQVGVIGVGAAKPTPAVHDGEIGVRAMMHVTLAADHRATDGADGARLLQTLRRILEQPGLMLL